MNRLIHGDSKSLTKAEQLAQVAHEWLCARRHPDDIAALIRKGCAELRITEDDARAIRSEVLS
jgi:hypothetical protein